MVPLERLEGSSRVDLAGIGTQPDKPAGRRHELRPTPVGRWAAEKGLHADKPVSVNSLEFIACLRSLAPDIVFVASFGQILKGELLSLPAVACVNLHASLLPAYRGAAPIAAAIADGVEKTGVSFMKMDAGLDTGPVYRSFELPVSGMDAVELELQLGELGAAKAEDMIEEIFHGRVFPEAQDDSIASYAGKISKDDGMLDWEDAAEVIERKIRAYRPWPGMSFVIESAARGIRVSVVEARVADFVGGGRPGSTVQADKHSWTVACKEGALELLKVKPDGGKVMTGAEFLRGRPEICVGIQKPPWPPCCPRKVD